MSLRGLETTRYPITVLFVRLSKMSWYVNSKSLEKLYTMEKIAIPIDVYKDLFQLNAVLATRGYRTTRNRSTVTATVKYAEPV